MVVDVQSFGATTGPTRPGVRGRPAVAVASMLVPAAGLALLAMTSAAAPPAPETQPADPRLTERTVVPWPDPQRRPARQPQPTGRLLSVGGSGPPTGGGELFRYRVEVEEGVGVSGKDFAAAVERTLADPRGWTSAQRVALQRVASGPAEITVALASPDLTDRLCAPLTTEGIYSCFNGSRAVINALRWEAGDDSYGTDRNGYRTYVVNHEVGHGLGHPHASCPRPAAPAPVMVQQTISLEGCAPNPWPTVG